METTLKSSPVRPLPDTVVPAPAHSSDSDPLPQVLREIAADCGIEPEKYLEEVRVPVGGE